MPPPTRMVASEILICGLEQFPFGRPAFDVLESIRRRHETLGQADRLAGIEEKLSRSERARRDRLVDEIGHILQVLRRPDLGGSALAGVVRNLWQLRGQGWTPTLFEGLSATARIGKT
jgi:hypothetical protein